MYAKKHQEKLNIPSIRTGPTFFLVYSYRTNLRWYSDFLSIYTVSNTIVPGSL